MDNNDEKLSLDLIRAVKQNNIEKAQKILSQGADVNFQTQDGATPLEEAANKNYNTEMVKLLLDHGADISTFKFSPFQISENNGQLVADLPPSSREIQDLLDAKKRKHATVSDKSQGKHASKALKRRKLDSPSRQR